MYREIATIIKNDSPKCITSEGGEDLLNQKFNNCEIDYDQYRFPDCTKSLCLEIKIKKYYLDKLYNLVKTLNVNNDYLGKCCGISTDFIRKLTDFFS